MPQTFHRTTHTWLLYLIFAVFGFVINTLGPVSPFLKAELGLSYTVSSLVFSAFAGGMILTGVVGHRLVLGLGRGRTLWLGLFGMCLSILGLAAAKAAWTAIGASFCTGFFGTLLPTVISSSLAEEHGAASPVALSENNLIAAVSSAAAPLMVGWFSYTFLGWRFALGLPLLAALALRFGVGRRLSVDGSPGGQAAPADRRLPARYWTLWLAIVVANAVEYCMLFWCADYLEHAAGLPRSVAAQGGSVFLAGVILGRLVGSRVVMRFRTYPVVTASILIAAVGFGLYWSAAAPWMPVVGLFLTGLGVANQFPLVLALAIDSSGGNTVQASARASLGAGIAIFALPLVLGRLADAVGIRMAYGLVAALLAVMFIIIRLTAKEPAVIEGRIDEYPA